MPIFIFLIMASVAIIALFTSGENFTKIDNFIKNDNKYLIGYAYNDNETNYKYLKWKSIIENPPNTIIALGSSRVLQFRANMFDAPFYNAGYTISSISDFVPFLESIPKDKHPTYLIIGLDQWMFNKSWDDLSKQKDSNTFVQSFSYFPTRRVWKNICKDLLTGKAKLFYSSANHRMITKIGLNAHINNKGFRKDGSIFYGTQITKLLINDSTANDYNYTNTYSRIKRGNSRFQYGATVNNDALSKLNDFLDFCKTNDIQVIAFLPPFANKVNAKLKSTGKYNYLENIYSRSFKYFKKYKFELYNFQHLEIYGSNDAETIDGFHGGELTYLKLLVYMLERHSKLNNVANINRLKKDIKYPLNRYIVYQY